MPEAGGKQASTKTKKPLLQHGGEPAIKKGVYTMSDYNNYNFTIRGTDLLRVLQDAASHGCQPLIIINGEFYNVELENAPSAVQDDDEIF